MNRFIDPDLIARTYRDPLAWLVLAVHLLPVLAVLALGWGATPLVALYWLENLIIGVVTVFRMLATGLASITSLLACLFVVPFFLVHYGLFCFVHGIFVQAFAGMASGNMDMEVPNLVKLVGWALGSGQGMALFVAAIAGINAVLFLTDFIGKGQFRETNPMAEMFAPYGRIVTLHVALILGAFIAIGIGQPLAGVLFLIVLRVAFGVLMAAHRRRRLEEGSGGPTAKEFPHGV